MGFVVVLVRGFVARIEEAWSGLVCRRLFSINGFVAGFSGLMLLELRCWS